MRPVRPLPSRNGWIASINDAFSAWRCIKRFPRIRAGTAFLNNDLGDGCANAVGKPADDPVHPNEIIGVNWPIALQILVAFPKRLPVIKHFFRRAVGLIHIFFAIGFIKFIVRDKNIFDCA